MRCRCSIFIFISAVLLTFPGAAVAFAGGDGSETNPYQIATPAHLNDIRNDPGAYYVLVADIDLDVAPYNTGDGWEPVGDSTTPFTGQLDGDGFEIRNLFIDTETTSNVGLFGRTETGAAVPGATVKNLALVNANVTGDNRVGAVAGNASVGIRLDSVSVSGSVAADRRGGCLTGVARSDSVIENSSASCTVTAFGGGNSRIGGITGELEGEAVILKSHATGAVIADNDYAGGLVGEMEDNAQIISSFATGNISGVDRVGGLVGQMQNSPTVLESFATGEVTGTGRRIGGLVGEAQNDATIGQSFATGAVSGSDECIGGLVGRHRNDAEIVDAYAWGAVSGGEIVGGLVGCLEGNAAITASYAVGAVTGVAPLGGLVGEADAGTSITDSYWDRDSTNQTSSDGSPDDDGLTTAQVQGTAAVTNMDGFDFDDIWTTVADGYPVLQWQSMEEPPRPVVPVPFASAWTLLMLSLVLLLVAAPVIRRFGGHQ